MGHAAVAGHTYWHASADGAASCVHRWPSARALDRSTCGADAHGLGFFSELPLHKAHIEPMYDTRHAHTRTSGLFVVGAAELVHHVHLHRFIRGGKQAAPVLIQPQVHSVLNRGLLEEFPVRRKYA